MPQLWDAPSGVDTILQVWRVGGREVMRERVLPNGNITRETWDDQSQSWRDIFWIETGPQGTSGGKTGVPHMGDAEWFHHASTASAGAIGYWDEYRYGGTPEDPEPRGQSIGSGWHGYDPATDVVFIGVENNHSLAFLTSTTPPRAVFPNQAESRIRITPDPLTGRARVEIQGSDFSVAGAVKLTVPDGERALVITDPVGNWRLTIQREGGQVVVEAHNGLRPVLRP